MKKIIKVLLGLLVGVGSGLLIGFGLFALTNDGGVSAFFEKLASINVLEVLLLIGLMILWLVVSAVLQIVIHEGGHLVAGLLMGYRFVSFRVFSLTLVRQEGRFRFRRFSIGGTGGQCLMAPPDKPIDQIDTRWYNLGGVLANVLVSGAALTLFLVCDLPMWAGTWMVMMTIIGVIYALLNGWPMKVGGIGNDGYNLVHLEKNPDDKRLLIQMLDCNARIQEGQLPKDLPEEYFEPQGEIDWGDGLQVNWQMMVVARMENLHQWDEVYKLLSDGIKARGKMPDLFWMETACEMVFVCLAIGRKDEAQRLYTPSLQNYVKTYSRTQSSKQRIAFAVELLMMDRRDEASQILDTLKNNRHKYLLQGEVEMDIELMETLLHFH
ncbi:MAG: hypothetical protein J6Y97_01685 [Prevotella sp.]|nr:hypothetical protein [Prevotella sp.]